MATILVVDDDPTTCKLIARSLADAGHVCRYAQSADEAASVAQSEPFQLLIADCMLKDESGIEVARQLAGQAGVAGVIFLTGLPRSVVEAGTRTIPGSLVLEKPVDLGVLMNTVARMLARPAVLPE